MDEITLSERILDQQSSYERAPYLTTHRALAACTRELERLGNELLAGVESLTTTLEAPPAVVRRPPGRCLIQLGPVALTVVWLRSTLDSVATGELMINVWHGAVSPRLHHRSERPGQERAPEPARLLWERVLRPIAVDEQSWGWVPDAADAMPMPSVALARMCADRLGRAYTDHLNQPEHR